LLKDSGGFFCVTGVGVGGLGEADFIESAHGGEHGTTNPCCILSIEVGMDVDVSILGRVLCNVSNLLIETFREALHQSSTSSEHNIVVQTNFEVSIALFNRIYSNVGNSRRFMMACTVAVRVFENARVENHFSRLEPFLVSNFNNLAARKFVTPLLHIQDIVTRIVVSIVVQRNMAHLFLHLLDLLVMLSCELHSAGL